MLTPIINPYDGIDFDNVIHAPSLSHAHSRVGYGEIVKSDTQRFIDRAVAAGIKHVAWSNYYRSIPFYPLLDFFASIPDGLVGSPNAEHHTFTNNGYSSMHINGLGSFYSSGKPYGEKPTGMSMSWEKAIPLILSGLQYSDGGGITINHPKWSRLNASMILPILHFSDLVLGIEIANSWKNSEAGELSTDIWDEILTTGQRAWGFCVPDHYVESGTQFTGRNVLLVDEVTEHNCLKAYRNGEFYGKLFDSGLSFKNINLNGNTFTVSAPLATSIHVYVNGNEIYNQNVQTAVVNLPESAKYVRAEAWLENYNWVHFDGTTSTETEKIFSNPIMFVKSTYTSHNDENRRVRVDDI